jgi:GNAT superfamily N-acetyltransferase
MSLSAPEPLAVHHVLEGFDCGRSVLNDWLLRHARQAHGSGSARTFVVADGGRVVGYYSLAVGQIDTADVPERVRKGMGQYPIPMILLARLAVDGACQGMGIGAGLLRDAIRRALAVAEQVGVRAIMTQPLDETASRFYQAFGFIRSPTVASYWLLLLKDARRLLDKSWPATQGAEVPEPAAVPIQPPQV